MANNNLNQAEIDFKHTLWQASEALRSNIDAAEYKNVVLGLIFLKYISDSFNEMNEKLKNDNKDQEDPKNYKDNNVFWVPPEARWNYLENSSNESEIGNLIDNAMIAIEQDNPELIDVLPQIYTKKSMTKQILVDLIRLIGETSLWNNENKENDVLGNVYEYFLGKFAAAEGKKGGQFYTPKSIVKILVEMIEPCEGTVFDPCCGSGGMFVQSEKFMKAHQCRTNDITIYGQESNLTTWQLCKINLAIRGIEAKIEFGNSFHNDKHKDLKADYILANPPFNDKNWNGEQTQIEWEYGTPPKNNANFAWVQHFISHLKPTGIAGFVLSNGSMSAGGEEGKIRKKIIENNFVDCIIALPSQLFYNTGIPACLWFIRLNKENDQFRGQKETLFIDARKMGYMKDRTHRDLTDDDISRIVGTYHAWRYECSEYDDIKGFCKSVNLDEIINQGHILTPSRYVGFVKEEEENPEEYEEKIRQLTHELAKQFRKSEELQKEIKSNLGGLGYDI